MDSERNFLREQEGSSDSRNHVRISKKLSWALRHGAAELKLEMKPDGFVLLSDLLSRKGFHGINVNVIKEIVANNSKKRFSLREDDDANLYIRANQGHSIKSIETTQLLTRIYRAEEIPLCVHGTYKRVWPNILASGALLSMGRNHVHFSTSLPEPLLKSEDIGENNRLISGIRRNAELLVYVDVEHAMSRGIQFYLSENEVILTERMPLEYVILVQDLTQGRKVIFRNGTVVET